MYNIDEIKKKIEKEYNENCIKMDDLKEKSITIKMNSLKTKLSFFCACFIIPGGLSILLFNGLANPSIIPSNLVYPIAIGLPTLIGITGERIISNKFKLKEKLKSFSKSKSDKEKIEESTRYELEIEKLEISNKILKETCKELDKKTSPLFTNFNKNDDKSIILSNIDNIKEDLNKKKQNIDTIVTKNFLESKFFENLNKSEKSRNLLLGFLFGVLTLTILSNLPNLIVLNNSFNLMNLAISFAAGGLLTSGYQIKRNKDSLYAFRNINNELGTEAIDEESKEESLNSDNQKFIDVEVINLINNSSFKKMQLELEKQKLNNLTIMENQTLNNNIGNTYLNYQIDDNQNIKEIKNVLAKRKILKK